MDDPACALDDALNGTEIGEIGDDDLFAVQSRGEIDNVGRAQGAIFLDQTRPQPASEDAGGTSEQGRACIGHARRVPVRERSLDKLVGRVYMLCFILQDVANRIPSASFTGAMVSEVQN